MIKITDKPISPLSVAARVKTSSSGCVVLYIGLIRDSSHHKAVLSVEYEDVDGTAENTLCQIASEVKQKWELNNIAIYHRVGKLKVGDVNLVIALASAHRQDSFAACQYAIDQFKEKMPTRKKETYLDGSFAIEKR
ncbi:MAG: molybdenum cofactor biosynthesis protein MoaE [Dehalococcoidia bacterium]|nr:MAG: molybdenum cofactor biosynthesis protein MoaE [Dehalococcoidia bacterium]